eukprot:3363775-Pyramimonas_sp.AAC.1
MVRGPIGNPTGGPSDTGCMRGPPPMSAHPSRSSWPHRELHRRPQWHRLHAGAATYFGTPLTRFVAPQGAQTKAPVAQ